MALLLKIPALFPTLATLMLSVASITLWIAPVAADSGKREAVQQDLILMQGKWKLIDFVYYRNGIANRLPKAQRTGLRVVTGKHYHLQLQIGSQKVDDNYSFRLYPNQSPKAFDVTLPDGRQIQGIYEVNTDTLRRCYTQPDLPRPTHFQAGDQTYQIWKRVVKPPVESPTVAP
jgi:uncharacterized protein (TIGR03067 family)